MLLDKALLFSDAQAVTVTAASTEALDMKAVDMGNGNPLTVQCAIGTAFVGGTSLAVAIQDCDTEGGVYKTVVSTAAIVTADLTAGKVIELGTLPLGTKRFVRLNYTVSGAYTAGTINAGIKLGANQDSAGTVIPA